MESGSAQRMSSTTYILYVAAHAFTATLIGLALSLPVYSATVAISNERSGNLVFMDDNGKNPQIVPICNRPRGMAQNKAKNSLYIACSDDAKVVEYDLVKRQIIRTYENLPGAMYLVFHTASGRLIVSNEGSSKATVVDTQTGNILATLATGLEPDGIALTDDGGLIFIASENAGLVHVFDGNDYSAVDIIVTNLRPRRLSIRKNELWVSSEMGSRVEIFNTHDFDKIDEIIFAPRGFRSEQLTPVDILFNQSGDTAYVALGSANHVVIIDAVKREILKYILVGRRPWGLALTPDDKQLFVLNGLSDDVTLIDVQKMRPLRTSRTGLVPHSVEVFD